MEFAVNYSPVLDRLVREGQVRFDRYKCPAWPDLIQDAQRTLPVYIHFPLTVGSGVGAPMNDEQQQPADLESIADLMDLTGTPLVNTHLIPACRQFPHIPHDSRDPRHIDEVVGAFFRDLEPLIRRFGAERVTVENIINEPAWLTLGVLPEVISRVLEETGCGFLFDLSHARLAARNLGLDERAYVRSLPLERIREVHITGLGLMEGELYERLMAAGNPGGFASSMSGKWMDHLPMTEADWPEVAWAAEEIRAGRWGQPWVIGYEYGGVGGFWERVTEQETYLKEIPRLSKILGKM